MRPGERSRNYGRFRSCAERITSRVGCTCDICRFRRQREKQRERERLAGFTREATASLRRPPTRFRCCGWTQEIPQDGQPKCGRCGEVPRWAIPDPDLRHLANGRRG